MEGSWISGEKLKSNFGQVVRAFQGGGGALGAYQAGVYEALHERGVEPDWVIGIFDLARSATLRSSPGTARRNRLAKLREFLAACRIERAPTLEFLLSYAALHLCSSLPNWSTLADAFLSSTRDSRPLPRASTGEQCELRSRRPPRGANGAAAVLEPRARLQIVQGGDRDLDFSGFKEVERPGGALTPHHELETIEEFARFPERSENQRNSDRRRKRDAERAGSAFAVPAASACAAAALSKHRVRIGSMRWPSSVRSVCGRSRRNSSPPSSPSSCLIARESEGCATPHSSAARVKLSARATDRKYRI